MTSKWMKDIKGAVVLFAVIFVVGCATESSDFGCVPESDVYSGDERVQKQAIKKLRQLRANGCLQRIAMNMPNMEGKSFSDHVRISALKALIPQGQIPLEYVGAVAVSEIERTSNGSLCFVKNRNTVVRDEALRAIEKDVVRFPKRIVFSFLCADVLDGRDVPDSRDPYVGKSFGGVVDGGYRLFAYNREIVEWIVEKWCKDNLSQLDDVVMSVGALGASRVNWDIREMNPHIRGFVEYCQNAIEKIAPRDYDEYQKLQAVKWRKPEMHGAHGAVNHLRLAYGRNPAIAMQIISKMLTNKDSNAQLIISECCEALPELADSYVRANAVGESAVKKAEWLLNGSEIPLAFFKSSAAQKILRDALEENRSYDFVHAACSKIEDKTLRDRIVRNALEGEFLTDRQTLELYKLLSPSGRESQEKVLVESMLTRVGSNYYAKIREVCSLTSEKTVQPYLISWLRKVDVNGEDCEDFKMAMADFADGIGVDTALDIMKAKRPLSCDLCLALTEAMEKNLFGRESDLDELIFALAASIRDLDGFENLVAKVSESRRSEFVRRTVCMFFPPATRPSLITLVGKILKMIPQNDRKFAAGDWYDQFLKEATSLDECVDFVCLFGDTSDVRMVISKIACKNAEEDRFVKEAEHVAQEEKRCENGVEEGGEREQAKTLVAQIAKKSIGEERRKARERMRHEFGARVEWMDGQIAEAEKLVKWKREQDTKTNLQVEEEFKEMRGNWTLFHGKVNDIGRVKKWLGGDTERIFVSIRVGRLGSFRDFDIKCIMSDKYVSYVRKWNLNQWVTVKGRIEREDGIFSADDITIDDGEPVAADDFELWCKINGFTVSQLEHEKHRMIEDDVKSVGNAIQSVGETLAPAASLLWGAVINGSK